MGRTISLGELARLVDGRLTGPADISTNAPIAGAATLREAAANEITLADKPELANQLAKSAATAAVVPIGFTANCDKALIEVDDVHAAFAKIVGHFRPAREMRPVGISPAAHISPTATLGKNVQVHPGVVIGDAAEIGDGCILHAHAVVMAGCRLGDDVELYPHAVLYEGTVVGDRTLIHSGAVIGAYGFGYRTENGRHIRCSQLGNVEIGADVEIGAGTTVDRGTYGPTRIGDGTKIDNQVQIAHNCQIGAHNVICSQVGIAGSATSGQYVVMAGQVGIADHVDLGDQVVLGAMSGVMNNVPSGETWVGIPARNERQEFQSLAHMRKLPEMRKQLRKLERRLDEVTASQSTANQSARQQDAA